MTEDELVSVTNCTPEFIASLHDLATELEQGKLRTVVAEFNIYDGLRRMLLVVEDAADAEDEEDA